MGAFFCGLMVGGCVGFSAAALLVVGRDEGWWRDED